MTIPRTILHDLPRDSSLMRQNNTNHSRTPTDLGLIAELICHLEQRSPSS